MLSPSDFTPAERAQIVALARRLQSKACYDMHRLSDGEATSRVEHLSKDDFAAEVARLAAELDAQPA